MKNALKHKQDMKKIQASSLDSGKVSAAITQQRPLQRLPSNGPHFFWNRLRAGKLDIPRLTLITYERRLSHRSPDTILTQEFKHRQAKIFLKRGVFFHNNAPAPARPTVGLDGEGWRSCTNKNSQPQQQQQRQIPYTIYPSLLKRRNIQKM